MHTAEHLLNQTMKRLFGCERSKNSHIERKKSKCDYFLAHEPTTEQIRNIEKQVNEVISQNLPVRSCLIDKNNTPDNIDLSKLPDNASQTLRLIFIGEYDSCACIGDHVKNTAEIGQFKIISTDFAEGKLRLRFKLENCNYTE